MTSNIGSHIIQEKIGSQNGGGDEQKFEDTRKEVFELLRQTIRPEFLNRVDEIIMFRPLSEKQIREIARIQLDALEEMLVKNGIKLLVTDEALDWIARAGYDPQYGARPVKRVIQRLVLNELSKMILAGKVSKDHEIVLDMQDDKLVFVND
jgi:ATP-dependent Clp protease ATP-binding subunit ClpB